MWSVFKLDETDVSRTASELVTGIIKSPKDKELFTKLADLYTYHLVNGNLATGRIYSQALRADDATLRLSNNGESVWLDYEDGWTLFLAATTTNEADDGEQRLTV